MMDYKQIGQRIRKFRRASRLSQEELAARVYISTVHMSHIETGNTKLSLPVLVDIAEALQVRTDELIYDQSIASLNTASGDIAAVLDSCTPQQAKVLADLVKALKLSMDKYL